MKKLILAFIVLIGLCLSSCTAKDNENDLEHSVDISEPVTETPSSSPLSEAPSATPVHTQTSEHDDRAAVSDTPSPENNNEDEVVDLITRVKAMSDEELLYYFINGLEICLINKSELLFNNPDEIPSQTLYMFFLYSLNDTLFSEDYSVYEDKWLKDDGLFHIPVDDITDQLSRFFESFNFDTSQLQEYVIDEYNSSEVVSYGYDSEENAIITPSISGFGGDVYTKVLTKYFEGDILTLVVDFYNNYQLDKLIERKSYGLRFYNIGYYFMSIKFLPIE